MKVALTKCIVDETLDAALEVSSLANDDVRPREYKPGYPDVNVMHSLLCSHKNVTRKGGRLLCLRKYEREVFFFVEVQRWSQDDQHESLSIFAAACIRLS